MACVSLYLAVLAVLSNAPPTCLVARCSPVRTFEREEIPQLPECHLLLSQSSQAAGLLAVAIEIHLCLSGNECLGFLLKSCLCDEGEIDPSAFV